MTLFWGRFSYSGLLFAIGALVIDQIHKSWMLHVFDIAEKGIVRVTPFFDLVMVWNRGISYGLFQQDSEAGRFFLVGVSILASLVLILVLARSETRLSAVSLGLIIGGALGNGIDRLIYGAVADFFSLHAFGFYWYVFNIADVAIVAGVIGLLYDLLVESRKKA
ncbi:MAG: signal peptidase II [Methyloligellaceae bacterium]